MKILMKLLLVCGIQCHVFAPEAAVNNSSSMVLPKGPIDVRVASTEETYLALV